MWLKSGVIALLYSVISILGLIGNITVIKTFGYVKSIRNVPNLLMCSLALGNVLLLLTWAPVDISSYLSNEWLFGRVGCKIIYFMQNIETGGVVLTLTALANERYKAIVKPQDIPTSSTTASIVLQVALIWLLPLVLAIPEAIFSDLHTFKVTFTNESFFTCAHAGELHPKIHSMASFLFFYVIPLLVISVYYILIARSLMRSASNRPVDGNLHARRQVESRKRFAKTVLVLVGLYAVCWLPHHVIYLYRSYHDSQVNTSMVYLVCSTLARFLAFANSCLNPFVFYLMSDTVQQQFNQQLCCCYHMILRRASHSPTHNTQVTYDRNSHQSMESLSMMNVSQV